MGEPRVLSIYDLFPELRGKIRSEAVAAGQMTLGNLIDALASLDGGLQITVDASGSAPGQFRSYRGYYEQIEFDPCGSNSTVAEFLMAAQSANGSTMVGYKGGDFVMHRDTMVWCSSYGAASGLRLVGIGIADGGVVLQTKESDDD